MITVFKTAIKVGDKETSAYTANELDKADVDVNLNVLAIAFTKNSLK